MRTFFGDICMKPVSEEVSWKYVQKIVLKTSDLGFDVLYYSTTNAFTFSTILPVLCAAPVIASVT